MNLEALKRAIEVLAANDQLEPGVQIYTRPQAVLIFGVDAVRDLPDRTVVKICGADCFIVGDRWPDLPTR